jgi:hypothetical protein
MLNRRAFVAHSNPTNALGNQRTNPQPQSSGIGKTHTKSTKRNAKAKSFYSPYQKMTPILSDDNVAMDQDHDEHQGRDNNSEIVKDAILVRITHT